MNTSTGGAKSGLWSQPDFTVALLRTYTYTSTRHIELVGYELKRAGEGNVKAIYEAHAHRRWVHYAYFVLFTPQGQDDDEELKQLKEECTRMGIGFITFSKVMDLESFKILLDPQYAEVPPNRVDDFIAERFGNAQEDLKNWMEGF